VKGNVSSVVAAEIYVPQFESPLLGPGCWTRIPCPVDRGPGYRRVRHADTNCSAGGVEGPAPSPIRAFFRWIRKIRLRIRPFVAKTGTMGKGERLSRM